MATKSVLFGGRPADDLGELRTNPLFKGRPDVIGGARRALGTEGHAQGTGHISGQLEVSTESGVDTEARVAELADSKDCCAEPMTRQLPIARRSHREQRRLLRPAD